MSSHRCVQVQKVGGPDSLEIVQTDVPSVGPQQILVKLSFAGVNFIDVYHRTGLYQRPLPFVPGGEGMGTVVRIGAEARDFQPGMRVAFVSAPGSYAEYAAIEAASAVAVPDGVSDEVAAAVLLQGMTAHYLCTDTYPVKSGDWCVVLAAAGGVGRLLTQLIKHRGGKVIGIVSDQAKVAAATEVGADLVLVNRDASYDVNVREITSGNGAAVVYDSVGKDTFHASLRALKKRGMLVSYGNASGAVAPFAPTLLSQHGSLYLTRPTLFDYTQTRSELEQRAQSLFELIAQSALSVHIDSIYPLEQVREAHRRIESRASIGKILISLGAPT